MLPIVLRVNSALEECRARIASNARSLRARVGISQEELASRANIDRTYASQIERGVANPSLEVLVRIAEALNVELHDLLCRHQQ